MTYLEELLPEFRKGAKIRRRDWEKEHYLYFECEDIWNEDNELVSFSGEDLICNSWELYQEPIDWDYIIKNKCLCWFWDNNESEKVVNFLKNIVPSIKCKFNGLFLNCRPVRRDEVIFYEDRKDVAED